MRGIWILLAICGCGSVKTTADAQTGDDAMNAPPDAPTFDPMGTTYFKASNTEAGDQFGFSLAISADGNTLAVGAYTEDSAAKTINGSQLDNTAASAGAVYVFVRGGGGWTQEAYIKASNTEAGDQFGYALAISADGNTLAVGAYDEDSAARTINGSQLDNTALSAGAVYVFTRSAATWTQQAYIKAPNAEAGDQFGLSLAVSADGNTLAIGANGEDGAATGVGGNQADNTASVAGAVYVYFRIGLTWTHQAYVKASNTDAGDQFGVSLAISADGNTLAVGASAEDSAATGVGGDQNDNTATLAGAVYLFSRSGATWTQDAYVKASNTNAVDQFGRSVALSGDGTALAASALTEDSAATGINGDQADNTAASSGAVYVFRNSGGWAQEAYVKASNTEASDQFGYAIALSGDGNTLAASALAEDSAAVGIDGIQTDNSAASSGAAYVFARRGSVWMQRHYVKSSNTEASDSFGRAVAITSAGTSIAVGASAEDSAATGVAGNQADNTASTAGAAYVIE